MAGETMPSIAQETTTPSQSSKKRRRDDNDNSHHLTLYAGLVANSTSTSANRHPVHRSHNSAAATATTTTTAAPRGIFNEKSYASTNHGHANLLHHQYASTIPPRTLMPLPSSKKQRTSVERDIEPGMDGEAMQRSPPTSPSQRSRSLADQSPTKQRPASPSRTSGAPATAAALMSRCHICFRKPTKKTDLDSFADCQGCGQRTCFVCIRECLGWAPTALQQPQILSTEEESSLVMVDADQAEEEANLGSGDPSSGDGKAKGTAGWERGGGHRQMVCSRCCIERGTEGDVVCLGCLPFVEG